jgi:hypothetical protein
MGSSTAAVAAETDAAWSPPRTDCPVVVVGGSVVVVVGSTLVVVGSVVVGSTVVVGAVTVGWVVVAPNVVRALVVVVRPTVADATVVAGRVGAVGPLAARGAVAGLVVDRAREVLGRRGRVVVVDTAVGAGSTGNVDSAPPGGRPGVGDGGSWGTRAAEATRAARTEAVSPKANSVSRQGWRGGCRCRGGRLAMAAVVPVRLVLPLLGCPPSARRTARIRRGPAQRIERRVRARRCGQGGGRLWASPPGNPVVVTWAAEAVRAAFGGNFKPALIATQGGPACVRPCGLALSRGGSTFLSQVSTRR